MVYKKYNKIIPMLRELSKNSLYAHTAGRKINYFNLLLLYIAKSKTDDEASRRLNQLKNVIEATYKWMESIAKQF